MAHLRGKSVYKSLTDRINKFSAGTPPSPLLARILEILFSPEEAGLVAQLPVRSFNARRAAKEWKVSLSKAKAGRVFRILDIRFADAPAG